MIKVEGQKKGKWSISRKVNGLGLKLRVQTLKIWRSWDKVDDLLTKIGRSTFWRVEPCTFSSESWFCDGWMSFRWVKDKKVLYYIHYIISLDFSIIIFESQILRYEDKCNLITKEEVFDILNKISFPKDSIIWFHNYYTVIRCSFNSRMPFTSNGSKWTVLVDFRDWSFINTDIKTKNSLKFRYP